MTAQLVDRPVGVSEADWAEIVDALTRREFLTGSAGAAVLGLGLAGHGVPRAAAAPATRVVDTAGGKVTVPADPTRVVCIDYFTAIFLLDLGLTPIGGIDYSGVDDFTMYPAYIAALTKLANIGQITSTNYEKVAALHPDLILGPTPGSRYDNSKDAMKTLGAVAPVASVNFGNTGDWRAPFAQAANIVNRAGRLRPLIAAYQHTVAAAKHAYADVLATTTVAVLDYAQNGQYAIDLPNSGNGVVLADLEARFAKVASAGGDESRLLSFERLDELADCDIILYRAAAQGKPGTGLAEVFTLDTWNQLPAVRAGHAYPIGWCDLCTYRWARAAVTDLTTIFNRYRRSTR